MSVKQCHEVEPVHDRPPFYVRGLCLLASILAERFLLSRERAETFPPRKVPALVRPCYEQGPRNERGRFQVRNYPQLDLSEKDRLQPAVRSVRFLAAQ